MWISMPYDACIVAVWPSSGGGGSGGKGGEFQCRREQASLSVLVTFDCCSVNPGCWSLDTGN
jgi:hypothetical protein